MSYNRVFQELKSLITRIVCEQHRAMDYPPDVKMEDMLPAVESHETYKAYLKEILEDFAVRVELSVSDGLIDIDFKNLSA